MWDLPYIKSTSYYYFCNTQWVPSGHHGKKMKQKWGPDGGISKNEMHVAHTHE
jgi:hypothetical protein